MKNFSCANYAVKQEAGAFDAVLCNHWAKAGLTVLEIIFFTRQKKSKINFGESKVRLNIGKEVKRTKQC